MLFFLFFIHYKLTFHFSKFEAEYKEYFQKISLQQTKKFRRKILNIQNLALNIKHSKKDARIFFQIAEIVSFDQIPCSRFGIKVTEIPNYFLFSFKFSRGLLILYHSQHGYSTSTPSNSKCNSTFSFTLTLISHRANPKMSILQLLTIVSPKELFLFFPKA